MALLHCVTYTESSAPTNLTEMSVGPNNIMIAWTAPSMPNGMISSYRVEVFYSGQPPRVENTGNAMTSFDIMGLDPFTNYTIRVAGVNDFGTGNFSNAITVQTAEDGTCLDTATQLTPPS